MRSLCWKCNFRANFGVLPQGFDVKALIPQGFTGSPNYFGFLNNLMTLIICESLREIGEVACVTSAWSSRGQTLKVTSHLRGSPSRKNRTRASLIKTPTNYIHVSEKKLNKCGLRSKYNSSEFSLRKCQKPVRR